MWMSIHFIMTIQNVYVCSTQKFKEGTSRMCPDFRRLDNEAAKKTLKFYTRGYHGANYPTYQVQT
jgi:hypothetical protein